MILFSLIGVIVKILVFLIVLSLIIVVHEAGHFLFAKKFGILCHEFSVGMGPAIYKKKKGETTYAIRAIPFGGYVSMAGGQFTEDFVKPGDVIGINLTDGVISEIIISDKVEADIKGRILRRDLYGVNGEPLEIELIDDYDTPIEELMDRDGVIYTVAPDAFFVDEKFRIQLAPYERCVESKPIWQRLITFLAGPFMNLLLAMVIYLICSFVSGTYDNSSSVIGSVGNNYPTTNILKPGDEIKSVNGKLVTSWDSFSSEMNHLALNGTTELTIVFERDNVEYTKVVEPYIQINSIGLTNIAIKDEYKTLTIPGAQVGAVGLNYKKDVSKKATQISNGDIITEVNAYDHKSSYSEEGWVGINSWSDIANIMLTQDVSNIYFRYYDCESGEFHDTYADSQAVESYGNEFLDSQRVQKIKLYIGVSPRYHHDFLESVEAAFENFVSDFTLIFRTLKIMIHPSGVRQVGISDLSGVVGIYNLVGRYMSLGIVALLLFMAMLSVNIGVMNLLPIPGLDGGKILFILIEGITRKPLNRKVEAMINNIMFILLFMLMIFVAYNDILKMR